MARKEMAVDSVAEAYLTLLAERGVEYLFANAGTDFAPLVEAFAKAARTGVPAPRPVLATHENLALSMAHGWAMVTGRVPAVMVHVSVGTANGVCGVFNAARENVPLLFTAGRSPLTEEGLPGARDVYIHWAQEKFDQAGWCANWSNRVRAEKRPSARNRCRSRPRRRHQRAQGAGLSVAAARGTGRAAARLFL